MRIICVCALAFALTACGAGSTDLAPVDRVADPAPVEGLQFGSESPSALNVVVPIQIRNYTSQSILTASLIDAAGTDVATLTAPVGPGSWADFAAVPTGYYTVQLATQVGAMTASGYVREDRDSNVYLFSFDLTPGGGGR